MADRELVGDNPIAVLDTNIVLDAISCVHLFKHYEKQPTPNPNAPDSVLRRQKARESLLLSIHLNNVKATTYSIFEAMRVTVREVSPDAQGAFETHAMIIWTHYVKDNVLPDWTMIGPSNGEGEPVGNAADALLVQKAKEFGVPLVTHEGLTTEGINHKAGIRRKAEKAGVQIMTARQLYGDMNELLHSALFMQAYARGAEAHIAKSQHPKYMRESMETLEAYYRHVLYGLTEGHDEPLAVRLQGGVDQ